MAIAWLAGAAIAGVAAYLVGWPALTASRERGQRDLNAERYLAWRGRTPRGDARRPTSMTDDERRRLWLGGVLALVAAICLVAFFVAS